MTKLSPDSEEMYHMQAALVLARRGLGRVWPNPAVGCVLVREDLGSRVVGRGWTQPSGRPHAETEALRRAGKDALGATAYVTLEPCSHHGETDACADVLVNAGVTRVVVAIEDPDPRVSGQGIARLNKAGIRVSTGIAAEAAADVNAGFVSRISRGRPIFTLKMATSLDGRIATASGESQWITSNLARRAGHLLRANHDAVMTGIGTAVSDRPRLTCRLPGMKDRSPVRIVVSSRLELPVEHPMVETAREVPTWVYCVEGERAGRRLELEEAGVLVIGLTVDEAGRVDLGAMASDMAGRGLTRILVEGGAELAGGLLRCDLIDRLCWFRAPVLIGGDGTPATSSIDVEVLDEAAAFTRVSISAMGADIMETYVRRN